MRLVSSSPQARMPAPPPRPTSVRGLGNDSRRRKHYAGTARDSTEQLRRGRESLSARCERERSGRRTLIGAGSGGHRNTSARIGTVRPGTRVTCVPGGPLAGPGQWFSTVRVIRQASRPRSVVPTCHTSARGCPARSGRPHGYRSIHRVTPKPAARQLRPTSLLLGGALLA
jgi:hypothetical protein